MNNQEQQSLLYSFVARGTVILAEHTNFSGNFIKSCALQCLEKLPPINNTFTCSHEGHTFNYLFDHGFIYCVISSDSADRWIPIFFLERVKDEFTKRYGGEINAAIAGANSLDQEFGPELKEQMQYCAENPEEISKLAKVKAEEEQEMLESIEKVLARGVICRMPQLDGTKEDQYPRLETSRTIRTKMWLKIMTTKVIVLGTLVFLILILVRKSSFFL